VEPTIPEEHPPEKKVPLWKQKYFKYAVVAVLLLIGVGVKLALNSFSRPAGGAPNDKMTLKTEPPKPATTLPATGTPAPKPAALAAVAATPPPAPANKPGQPTPGLSETQNAIAHAPVNAINKAQSVIDARSNSGQSRETVGAITEGDQPAPPADKTAVITPTAPQTVATSSTIAPGVSATNDNVSAAAEASPAFRSFVANAKISGVFQGAPPRVMINGRLARAGDTVDSALAITFDGIDPDKKLILFKDKFGAVVTRRY
jgi:hypothetical protein